MNDCAIYFHNMHCFLDKCRTSLIMTISYENYLLGSMTL